MLKPQHKGVNNNMNYKEAQLEIHIRFWQSNAKNLHTEVSNLAKLATMQLLNAKIIEHITYEPVTCMQH